MAHDPLPALQVGAATPRQDFDFLFGVEAILDRAYITPRLRSGEPVAVFAARAVTELRRHARLHLRIAAEVEVLLEAHDLACVAEVR